MNDTAYWTAIAGWGGKDHRYEDWTGDFDDFSDLADDPVLAAELAEDAKLDGPPIEPKHGMTCRACDGDIATCHCWDDVT